MRLIALTFAGIGVAIYVLIHAVIFLVHSISVVFMIPIRIFEEHLAYDFSKNPPLKIGFLRRLRLIYHHEMRGNLFYDVFIEEFADPSWKKIN